MRRLSRLATMPGRQVERPAASELQKARSIPGRRRALPVAADVPAIFIPAMHFRASLVSLSLAIVAAACGSSSTTSTAPATVPRCGVTLATTELTVPAAGGTGRLAITTARECAWTASSNAGWLAVSGPSSGQGDGSIDYTVASNSDATTRRGVIELNDQKANVTQAAAACVMSLGETSENFSPAGGSGTISVQASSAGCPWTAAADTNWITVRTAL